MKVRFWGVRGSYAVPGPDTSRYGGNTSCVEVKIDGGPRIVLDAGTGIRKLGKEIIASEPGKSQTHLLVSHTHWDHIQGLPYFAPLYQRGHKVNVFALQRDDKNLREVFASQSDSAYFPVTFDEVQAQLTFRELTENAEFELGPVKVRCTRLNHPWIAIAYRLDHEGKSFCYVTDTAPFRDILIEHDFIRKPPQPGESLKAEDAAKLAQMREGVVRLCEGADLVIYDTQFTPAEYLARPHWGHSCPDDAVEIVRAAGAKSLVLYHHAPERTDAQVDEILADQRSKNPDLDLIAAAEGNEVLVGVTGGGR